MKIVNIFENKINTIPSTIQFAKDRKYEEAWIINKNDKTPSRAEIEQYLNGKFDLLIVELIWEQPEYPSPFVITIFLDNNCFLTDKHEFIGTCLNLFYNYTNFNKFVSDYNKKIIGEEFLLNSEIEGIRIGVFNHWLSVGPIELWNKGEKIDMNVFQDKIHARPEVEKTNLNFQSLLFTFNSSGNGYPFHGIKTPISKKTGNSWEIDLSKVNYWINKLLIENHE